MRRLRRLCAIGAGLCSIVVGGCQTASAGALPEPLRAHVKDDRWGMVTSIRGLPLGVREELRMMFGSQTLDIADPGDRFQSGSDAGDQALPSRRMIAAGCSTGYCLIYYERAGSAPTWHVALFHWEPEQTRFEWGGLAPAGLATIDAVRKAVLSGAIKSPNTIW